MFGTEEPMPSLTRPKSKPFPVETVCLMLILATGPSTMSNTLLNQFFVIIE